MRRATLAGRAGGDAGATDTGGSRHRRRRTLPPSLQGLLAFLIYLGVFIVAFGQALVSHLNVPQVGQNEVDPNFYIWAWRWWIYAVTNHTNPLYSYQINAPVGYNLAWATTAPSTALLMWPVTSTLGPVVSFNVTLLLAPPASAWAAFVAARRLTGRFWASLPAGVIFAFNVYTLDHSISGQPNLTVNLLLPLMVYLVTLWWEKRLRLVGYVLWMTLALALEFYTFVEAFAQISLMWVFGLLIALALAGRGNWLRVVKLGGLTLVAFVGAVILAAPYLNYALHHYPQALLRQDPRFSLDIAGLVIPRGDRLLGLPFWVASAGHDMSSTAYLSVPLLLVLVLLVIMRWRSRVVWLLFLGLIVILLLATGPKLIIDGRQELEWPWNALWTLPIFKSAEPVRFIMPAYLVLSIALAWWLAAVTRSRVLVAVRWLLGLLAMAAVLADLPTFAEVVIPPKPVAWVPAMPQLGQPTQIPSFFTDGSYRRYLTPGENVVVLSRRGNAGMLFQAYTGFYFRLDGGFINASLSDASGTPWWVEDMSFPTPLRISDFEEHARSANVGAVIVEQAWSQVWNYNFNKIGLTPISVGGVTIYQTRAIKASNGQRIPLFPGIYP